MEKRKKWGRKTSTAGGGRILRKGKGLNDKGEEVTLECLTFSSWGRVKRTPKESQRIDLSGNVPLQRKETKRGSKIGI